MFVYRLPQVNTKNTSTPHFLHETIKNATASYLVAALFIMQHRTLCVISVILYALTLSSGLTDGDLRLKISNNNRNMRISTSNTSKTNNELSRIYFEEMVKDSGRSLIETENETINENTIDLIVRRTTVWPTYYPDSRNIDSQKPNSPEGESTPSTIPRPVKPRRRDCDRDHLKRCVDGLPPMNDTGLPTSPQAVNTACRTYDSGISCFDNWAKNCLPKKNRQKVRSSITGAHEMYSFLCKDLKFRNDYLKHSSCYKHLSPYWDDCSRVFIEGLKKNIDNVTTFCCIRLEFITCVSRASSRLCSFEATRFSLKMAETLIRSKTKHHIEDCAHVHPQNCFPIGRGGRLGSSLLGISLAFLLSQLIARGL